MSGDDVDREEAKRSRLQLSDRFQTESDDGVDAPKGHKKGRGREYRNSWEEPRPRPRTFVPRRNFVARRGPR